MKALIQKMYGEAIVADVADAVMQRHFVEALVAEKLNPVGAPTGTKSTGTGSIYVFHCFFEVYPEFKVQNLDAS